MNKGPSYEYEYEYTCERKCELILEELDRELDKINKLELLSSFIKRLPLIVLPL